MESNMKHFYMGQEEQVTRGDIWHQRGYTSTDCGEENDEKEEKKKKSQEEEAKEEEDGEEYYYDEEEEEEGEEMPDLTITGT